MSVIWSDQGWDDLRGIVRDILDFSRDAAQRVRDDIERALARLDGHTHIGRPGRMAGTRELVVRSRPYVLIYRVEKNDVVILRVRHGARQWPPHPTD